MSVPTDQEILDALKTAYIDAVGGKTVVVYGRTYTVHDLPDLLKQIEAFERRISTSADSNVDNLLVSFGEPE